MNYTSQKKIASIFTFVLLFIIIPNVICSQNLPPETKKQTVSDEYHDVTVSEDYRWLEDFTSSEVKEWNKSQNGYTRDHLDNLPARNLIKKQLQELLGGSSTDYYSIKLVNGTIFALKFQPPKEQPLFITLESLDDPSTEKIILDVTELDSEATTSIDFYVPSTDGKLVAISLSKKGSEIGDIYILDLATGEMLEDVVPRVNGPTAGGDVAWVADNSGFYYTRYPREGERPQEDLQFYQQVYYHQLGTSTTEDKYAIGEEFPYIAEIVLEESDDAKSFIATVANGDGGEYAHYLLNQTGEWHKIADFEDLSPVATFGSDNSIFLLSRFNAPMGKILKLAPEEIDITKAIVVVPESDVTIKYFQPVDKYLYISDLDGGPSKLRLVDITTFEQKEIPVKEICSVRNLIALDNNELLFRCGSYTEPSAWMRFNPEKWKISLTGLYMTSPADFSDIEVTREFATSKDGTKVPLNIIRRKGTELNGENPTILYGYGGYGISLMPYFDPAMRLWFDQGGIYVIANIRGGGEYGEEWHLQGNLTKKQNVFDDFAAGAEYLIEQKYTNPKKLAIKGGSNGGLLMGAAFTQRPELFGCVVSYVGIYDMLRVELDPNGVFNITEFGTVKIPEHFEALYAYSPYHNVKDNTSYPGIIFLTGDHDGRVNPGQSRKMTARMQTATNSGKPIFLRTSAKSGHGGGTALSEKIERETDVFSFIVDQLGINFKYDK